MAAAVAWRLALPVYKSSPSALQRQQRARPAALLAHRAGARRLIVCEAASPQPSSPGSQPAGSGPFSQDELESMLQTILDKQEAQLEMINLLLEIQETILKKQDEHSERLDSLLKAHEKWTEDMEDIENALKDVQAEQAVRVKEFTALVENSKRMQRLLSGEDKKQRSGDDEPKGP
ncbi:hypothetical protein ABPG77_009089 [Micractinium sp. CCAP 211/92]